MKKSTKIWLSVAGAAVIIGVTLMVVAMGFGDVTGIYLDSNWKFHTIEKDDKEVFDSEPLSGVTEIDIKLRDDNIVIKESEDEYVHVHVDSTYGGRAAVTVEDGKLAIVQNTYKRYVVVNFDFRLWSQQDEVVIYVPKNNNIKNVSLETGDGNIEVYAPMDVDQINLLTSSGNIYLSNVDSKETNVKTSDGNITANGSFLNTTNLKTSSGNITSSAAFTGQVNMQTSDGNVTVDANSKRSESAIEAKTSDGAVRINDSKVASTYTERNGTKNTFSLKTSSGNISLDLK